MKKQRISVTTQALIMISALLLTFSILLGSMLLSRSKSLMKFLINQRMLDIANSSADMLDGDFLRTIREDDIGSPEFRKSYDTLKVFQDNIDLEYIYTVRDEGDGRFTFTVDPAEEDPGEYGEEIVVTPALLIAAQGTAASTAPIALCSTPRAKWAQSSAWISVRIGTNSRSQTTPKRWYSSACYF